MRLIASRSIPGAVGLTVALETTDGVGDTEVRERYSPDDGGERDIGVKGRGSDEGELDGDEGNDDDGGEDDMGEDDSSWI
jgi:hypothetical protein